MMGAGRETARGADVRNLRNEQFQSAADVAGSEGNIEAGIIGAAVL